jgi:hypothetical protein
MQAMLKHSMLMVAFATLVGCGGGKLDKVEKGLAEYKDKMCACKDKACTEKVQEEYKKWENDVLEPTVKGMNEKDIDKGTMEKLDKLDDGRKECRRKFRDADVPTPPTPAPTEGSAAPTEGSAAPTP